MPRNRAPAIALMLGHVKLPRRHNPKDVVVGATVWLSTINRHNRLEREAAATLAAASEPVTPAAVTPPARPAREAMPDTALVVWQPTAIAAFSKA